MDAARDAPLRLDGSFFVGCSDVRNDARVLDDRVDPERPRDVVVLLLDAMRSP